MTKPVSLKNLTEKQRQVWGLRYRKRWRMKKIALAMGMSGSGVSKMLQRAQIRAGLPVFRISVIRPKSRFVPVSYMSEVFEQY